MWSEPLEGFEDSDLSVRETLRMAWGLIPSFVKTADQAKEIWNHTLNARAETMHKKPSYRPQLKQHRCVIWVTGFFEFHQYNGKKFPFYVYPTGPIPVFPIAGLWSEWEYERARTRTFTVVTTAADKHDLMRELHNNPHMEDSGPRMPLILPFEKVSTWLDNNQTYEQLMQLFQPYEGGMAAHTVRPIIGQGSVGNNIRAIEKFMYPEFENRLF